LVHMTRPSWYTKFGRIGAHDSAELVHTTAELVHKRWLH